MGHLPFRFIHQLKHQEYVYPNIPFRMKLGRLLNPLQI